jgi:phosphoribosylformimino-5-aminoimidazole carboxamide ribotide isomerase
MIFFPAIDLKDGQCVRLLRGEMDQATVYGDDPAAQARTFAAAGCSWLHVVDLNGAFEGKPVNKNAVDSILPATGMKVEMGGGIREISTISMWLEAGIARVILGTAALKDPALVRAACRQFPGRIAVGIDAKDGFVAVEGWAETSSIAPLDLARQFEDAGVAAIIFTDISRDGAMEGPNIDATVELAGAISIPVIASGGVSSMDDLKNIKVIGEGKLEGVIAGRAVYDGSVDPKDAVALLEAA